MGVTAEVALEATVEVMDVEVWDTEVEAMG